MTKRTFVPRASTAVVTYEGAESLCTSGKDNTLIVAADGEFHLAEPEATPPPSPTPTERQTGAVDSYIGRRPCGCINSWASFELGKRELARSVARMLRDGEVISAVNTDEVRSQVGKRCPQCERPPRKLSEPEPGFALTMEPEHAPPPPLTDAERNALHWLAIQCCSQDLQVAELATRLLTMIGERQDALDRLTSPAATPTEEVMPSDPVQSGTPAEQCRQQVLDFAPVKTTERQMRAEAATKLLEAIGHSGRQFFRHLTRTARMEVDSRGRVWFIDHYTSKRVYTHYRGQWRGFTSGGTMRSLVEALREFIRKGTPVPSHHFGPWPDWYCDGDLWGYGRLEMEKVRQRARDLGLVPHDA